MESRLTGKKAFITGGAQGLGLAMGKMFMAEGADVTLTDIQVDKVAEAAESIGAAAGIEHDVTDPEVWKSALAAANEQMDGINVLVHNAGIGSFGNVETETLEMYRKVMAIDTDSVFIGSNAAMPYLKDNAPGSIIIISSVAGLMADGNFLAYNTAKAAVAMMGKSIALHCARNQLNITCNSIHPVFTRTAIIDPMIAMKGSQEEGERALSRNIPMKRIGEPEEVAAMATYLASDEAKFVTGSEFRIDGGITACGVGSK
ncbi:MAG: SDR family oxidoreductase [Pseudomonadota bacterium]